MVKTVGDFIGHRKFQEPPAHKMYYLDDVVEKNPMQYCPHCESPEIEQLHTHNIDGTDYKCYSCQGTYEIVHLTKREDIGH